MFKLYGYVEDDFGNLRYGKLNESESEYEIIKTIDEDIKTTEIIHYLIIKRENNTDNYYASINCYEDFIDYIEYYRRSHGISESDKVQRGKNK